MCYWSAGTALNQRTGATAEPRLQPVQWGPLTERWRCTQDCSAPGLGRPSARAPNPHLLRPCSHVSAGALAHCSGYPLANVHSGLFKPAPERIWLPITTHISDNLSKLLA